MSSEIAEQGILYFLTGSVWIVSYEIAKYLHNGDNKKIFKHNLEEAFSTYFIPFTYFTHFLFYFLLGWGYPKYVIWHQLTGCLWEYMEHYYGKYIDGRKNTIEKHSQYYGDYAWRENYYDILFNSLGEICGYMLSINMTMPTKWIYIWFLIIGWIAVFYRQRVSLCDVYRFIIIKLSLR